MKKALIAIVVLAAAGGGGAYAYTRYYAPHKTACTLEAKICPDGSTVGRTGPNCEFAACPTPKAPEPPTVTQTVGIGENATGYGMTVTPLDVTEDSRCPAGAACVQKGTVRLSVFLDTRLGTTTSAFALGQPVPLEQGVITMTSVDPPAASGTVIASSSYRFTFEFTERQTPTK